MIDDTILVRTMRVAKKEPDSLTPAVDDPFDLELAVEASGGDKGAFERLMWRWWDRIRGYCAAFCRL